MTILVADDGLIVEAVSEEEFIGNDALDFTSLEAVEVAVVKEEIDEPEKVVEYESKVEFTTLE